MNTPKTILRSIKRKLLVSNIDQPPIVIMASRRGGSTWIAEAIAAQKGVWFANEPFAVLPFHEDYNVKNKYLPIKEHSQYFDLKAGELEQFKQYIVKLLAAKIRPLGTCKNPEFPLKINRVLLKVLNAPWMLDWFLSNTNAKVVFLSRHPGSQAVSVIRQGWDFGVKAYFHQLDSVHSVFSDSQVNAGLDIIQKGNKWDTAILDWVVSTHHGRNTTHESLIKLAYEDVIINPSYFMNTIMITELGCGDIKLAEQSLGKPSGSSSMSTKNTTELIKDGNKGALLSKWKAHVSKEELARASAILDLFEVATYSMHEEKPL